MARSHSCCKFEVCADMKRLGQHARQFLERASKHESSKKNTPTEDIAEIHKVLRKRDKNKQQKLLEEENEQPQTTRPTKGHGSETDPLVID